MNYNNDEGDFARFCTTIAAFYLSKPKLAQLRVEGELRTATETFAAFAGIGID